MQTLPVDTDLDLCSITPAGGARALLSSLVNGGTNNLTVLSGGKQTFASGATLSVQGVLAEAVQNAVTAGVTHSVAGATALAPGVAVITTVSTVLDAVKLPILGQIGQRVRIINNGASNAGIWPGETATSSIDGAGTNTAVTLTAANGALFIQNTASTWVSTGKGPKSS